MKILILGNGFDLEHDLKTKYTDFLFFCECVLGRSNDSSASQITTNLEKEKGILLKQHIADNYWINLILEKKDAIGDKWIDFETEIYRKIREIDTVWMEFDTDDIDCDLEELSKEKNSNGYSRLINAYGLYKNYSGKKIKTIRSIRDLLLDDLNRLICAFELYLSANIESKDVVKYNKDILDIFPDKVLTFNYTDTYERVYSLVHNNAECYHIHGKLGLNNLILGIDEYLLESERMSDTVFIDFQKYFQRIKKCTGNEQMKWLKTIDESYEYNEVYFLVIHLEKAMVIL